MKKLLIAVALLSFCTPAFAQTTIMNNSPSRMGSAIGNTLGNRTNNNTMPTTMQAGDTQINNTQGVHIKNLEERRQEQMAKQQQQMERSGIRIQNIPQQNSNMIIQPGNFQNGQANIPQPIQNNGSNMNGMNNN